MQRASRSTLLSADCADRLTHECSHLTQDARSGPTYPRIHASSAPPCGPTVSVGDDASLRAGESLQSLLSPLLDLGLSIKHAHWNCYGAGFRDLYLHLRELGDAVDDIVESVAERAVACGVSPDGRLQSIVASSPLSPLPAGAMLVDATIAAIADSLDQVVRIGRGHLNALSDGDPVARDVVAAAVAVLERHRWMLVAEFSTEPPARSPVVPP